jgi:hypothetical protein
MRGENDERPSPADGGSSVKPKTQRDLVRAGVARAAFLDGFLRIPRVLSTLGEPGSSADEARPGDPLDEPANRILNSMTVRLARLTLIVNLTRELDLAWMGSWLPAFLDAAGEFRRELGNVNLGSCTIADPHLRFARACLRSWAREDERGSSRQNRLHTIGLLGAVMPDNEPSDWGDRTPDWIELFTTLIEHAAERPDWASDVAGPDRSWPHLLWPSFVVDTQSVDDPEVLHGLVDLWASTCHGIIEDHTRPRLPRGLVPDNSGLYADGRAREGGRDKIRRWVGWYLDREVRHVALNDILRAAFPDSANRHERSSELKHHIREAKQLLALELPLDAGQPLRLWKLAQQHRSLLEQFYKVAQEHGLAPPELPAGG